MNDYINTESAISTQTLSQTKTPTNTQPVRSPTGDMSPCQMLHTTTYLTTKTPAHKTITSNNSTHLSNTQNVDNTLTTTRNPFDPPPPLPISRKSNISI